MNKTVYLGLSVTEITKVVMFEFRYNYVKRKHREKVKLCYMDADSLIVYTKTLDIYSDIVKDDETRSDSSIYKLYRPLPKEKYKEIIGLLDDESGGEIMTECATLIPKTYNCLKNDGDENKKLKDTKKFVLK